MAFIINFGAILLVSRAVQASVDYGALHGSSIRKSSSSASEGNSHFGTTLYPDIIDTASAYEASDTAANYFSDAYMSYHSYDIPYYKHTVTSCDMSYLENRPHKSSELVTIAIEEGDIIKFGDDVGFACPYTGQQGSGQCACVKSADDVYTFYAGACSNSGWSPSSTSYTFSELVICDEDGAGYWPPGPSCASDQSPTYFDVTLSPRPNTQTDKSKGCYLPMGMQGIFVNGVAFFGWADGQDYESDGYWHNIALVFEYYDFDICYGHATNLGQYHHHTYSPCLAELLGDQGLSHSPVYGFARDGYPIYGPWQDSAKLAQSCWKTRNYDGLNTLAGGWGCLTSDDDTTNKGKRTCLLDDQWDPTATTTMSSSSTYGPGTSDSVVSQSGNSYTATSGSYWEDFYYDSVCGASGGAYLNEHNGHDHDNYGFHYHLTVDSAQLPQFPFGIGPQFYGALPAGQKNYCCNTVENAGTGSCSTTSGSTSNYANQVEGSTVASNSVPSFTTASYTNYETHSNPFCSSVSIDAEVTLSGFTSASITSAQSNAIISAVADVTGVLTTDVTITSYTAYALNRRLTSSEIRRQLTTSWSINFIINISANYAFITLYSGSAASATSTSTLQSAVTTAFSTAISGDASIFINAINASCNSTCNLPSLTISENPSDDDTDGDKKMFNPLILVAIAAIIPIGIIFYCFYRNKQSAADGVEMTKKIHVSPGTNVGKPAPYSTADVNDKNNKNKKVSL